MNRMKQLKRYRQRNANKKVMEIMQKIYRQNLLKQTRSLSVVQQARVVALMDGRTHS